MTQLWPREWSQIGWTKSLCERLQRELFVLCTGDSNEEAKFASADIQATSLTNDNPQGFLQTPKWPECYIHEQLRRRPTWQMSSERLLWGGNADEKNRGPLAGNNDISYPGQATPRLIGNFEPQKDLWDSRGQTEKQRRA